MKKLLAGAALAAATAMSIPTANAAGTVDVDTRIISATAVPGGFTAGSWSIANPTAGTMPAGATYLVKFSRLPSGDITGTTTVTSTQFNAVKVQALSNHVYRITLTQDLLPGQFVSGAWSDAHWFNIGQRDKVTISSENIPAGTVDTNSANDTSTYDNSGQGF